MRSFYFDPTVVELDNACWANVDRSQQTVSELLKTGESIYGLNTGFGLLAKKRISDEDLAQLQLNPCAVARGWCRRTTRKAGRSAHFVAETCQSRAWVFGRPA